MKKLDGPERQRLRQILGPLLNLKQFDKLLDSINVDRELIASNGSKDDILFDVIDEANKALWLVELVEAVRKFRPQDPDLYEFAVTHYGLGIRGAPSRDAFEKLVIPGHKFIPFGVFNSKSAAVERQVCRITYPLAGDTCNATGFLIGESEVLTNHHVIAPILNKKVSPEKVSVQFDYKVVGGKPQDGRFVKLLASDWHIDSSEPAPGDDKVSSATLPKETELDYGLIRLAEPVGSQPIGPETDAKQETRGWMDLRTAAQDDPPIGSPVIIVQHPRGEPLSMALELDSILSVNGNSTRVRYKTNTAGGSSGSPVFDLEWNLIALHHVGDPRAAGHKPEFNQGVIIRHITALLTQHGKLPGNQH